MIAYIFVKVYYSTTYIHIEFGEIEIYQRLSSPLHGNSTFPINSGHIYSFLFNYNDVYSLILLWEQGQFVNMCSNFQLKEWNAASHDWIMQTMANNPKKNLILAHILWSFCWVNSLKSIKFFHHDEVWRILGTIVLRKYMDGLNLRVVIWSSPSHKPERKFPIGN